MFISPFDTKFLKKIVSIKFFTMSLSSPREILGTEKFSTKGQSDALNKFQGTQYYDLLSSNPYENQEYHNGLWDKFGDMFGFRTAQDKRREDLSLQSSAFISQVESLAREEQYSSEEQKVKRMRDAGLNPDLMGIESASSASEFNEPESLPEAPSGSENGQSFIQVASVGSSIFNGFQMAVSLFHGFQEIKSKRLANTASSIANANSMSDFASQVLLDAVDPRGPGFDFRDESGVWQFTSDGDLESLAKKYGESNVRDHVLVDFNKINSIRFSNKRDQKLFSNTISRVMNGLPQNAKEFKTWYDREFVRRSYFQKRGSEFFDDDDLIMQELIRPFSFALDELSKIEVDVASERAKNDLDYEQNFDATALAEAENAENELSNTQKSTEQQIQKVWNDLARSMSELQKKYPIAGAIGLLVVGFLRSQSLQVHYSRRSTTKTAPNGEVTSYDRNFLSF